MYGRNGLDEPPTRQGDAAAYFHRHQLQHRMRRAGQTGKVRPDMAIENMLVHAVQHLGARINLDGRQIIFHSMAQHAFREHGQAHDVIQMRMRQKNLLNTLLYRQGQIARTRARINQGISIQQECRCMDTGIYSARSAQYFDLHDQLPEKGSPPAWPKAVNTPLPQMPKCYKDYLRILVSNARRNHCALDPCRHIALGCCAHP